ncbi:hypothetical protein ANCCEY_10702 [Ancylostoma ceylanicum]|uniref:Uncharacterized protein n=1 Tax=Ancylostoma ceylanicum TaxID=53326 RepID=A0A0D6LJR0_9BILA|nr:hypothetical protein ANCCEY_10702 [Ancylostoma ceylanicum]
MWGCAIEQSIACAWLKWRESTGILCDRRCSRVLKGKIYRTVVRPAMMYGSECWPVTKAHERMLNTAEMRMLRWACGLTRRDKDVKKADAGAASSGVTGGIMGAIRKTSVGFLLLTGKH